MRLWLQICKLEIEADKEVRLILFFTIKAAFDVGKNIAVVPLFREAEVDSYFNAFEQIA